MAGSAHDSTPSGTNMGGEGPVDEPVFRVVRLVSTSGSSWEEAARLGVAEAARSNPGLATAKVIDADTLIADGGVVRYR
ncbi:MAG: dodecin domain-containing protein, partial [Actinomycetota bacterium]